MARLHPAVGIDLGTTNSTVAFVDTAGRPETIRNSEGGLSTPSAVFFDRTAPVVGAEAMEAGVEEPDRLALFAKRDVGERAFRKSICGASFPPEVLQALVLRKLKQDAELKLGSIDKAVITVPAFFNEPCRKSTQDAGRMAGLEVLDIINEPTAAAICFGVQQGFLSPDGESEQEERVLVYDLGGGTFDVTVMEIKERHYQTIATNGDVYLGGIDWDRRIVDFIAEAWMDEYVDDPREDPIAEQLLLRKANQTKHALTQRDSVPIAFAHQGQRIRPEFNRDTFHRLTEDLLERTLMTVGLVLDEAGMGWGDLTRLILVGGSTRMPMIRDELSRLTSLELDRSLSPDEAVAHGAAIYAGIRLGQGCKTFSGVSVTNVNSHDLGVLAKDPKTGEPRRQVMIKRNTTLPARQRIRFRTHEHGQQNVKVQVVEGGDDKGRNATPIGKCLIESLPPDTPKGTFVDVQFDYSQDGRLTVSATLPALRCNARMTMNRAAGMSDKVMSTWQQRIEDGITEETITEVLSLAAESGRDSCDHAATKASEVTEVTEVTEDAASAGSGNGLSGKDSLGDATDNGAAFPGIRVGAKPSSVEKKETPFVTENPDFTEGKAKPTLQVPIVDASADAIAPVKKLRKGKLSKQNRAKKLSRKSVVETPTIGALAPEGKAGAGKNDVVKVEGPASNTATSSLPQPKRPAHKQTPVGNELPAGLADLAKASGDAPDLSGNTSSDKKDRVGFSPIEVESAASPAAGDSDLDAFFSSQDSAKSSGSIPTPTIEIQTLRSPKKLNRDALKKPKTASSESDRDSDWKRRGQRLSSGDKGLE